MLFSESAAGPMAARTISSLVFPGLDAHLIYTPDGQADRIPDFSNVGYQGGTVPLPNVQVKATVSPGAGDEECRIKCAGAGEEECRIIEKECRIKCDGTDDDECCIQCAIDGVSKLPLDANGFRGAVLLTAGEYQIRGSIQIRSSGVVLRGEGDGPSGTVLRATATNECSLKNQCTLIQVFGSGSRAIVTTHNIIDKYVPVGARSFRVDDTAGLAVGNTVIVHRPSTDEWIRDIYMDLVCMDLVCEDPPSTDPMCRPWTSGSKDLSFDRVITRIEGNQITIDAPLTNSLDQNYGGGQIYLYRYTWPGPWPGRMEKIGIEHIRGISNFANDTDENHSWVFISLDSVQNAWVRDITAVHFANSAVTIGDDGKWITVENSKCLDPKSELEGGRRYSFNVDGELNLVRNNYARRGRHDYVMGSLTASPNVFVDNRAVRACADTGPHHRWSVGGLFDNVNVKGEGEDEEEEVELCDKGETERGMINVQNRGNLGTGHGWDGANMVIWNSTASRGFIVQNPPTAQNWLIGSTGPRHRGRHYCGPTPEPGIIKSHGTPVQPRSLYYAQLQDRLRNPGTKDLEYWLGDIDGFQTGDAADAVPVDPAWRAEIEAATGSPLDGFDALRPNHWVPFTFDFNLAAGEQVVSATLSLGLRSMGGRIGTDRIYLDSLGTKYSFQELGWLPLPTTGARARVLDLSDLLHLLQDGRLNVALQDDTAVDWAVLNLQVAPKVTPHVVVRNPMADAFVRDGSHATQNFGTAGILTVKKQPSGDFTREAYVRFDLAGISGTLLGATVRLMPRSVGGPVENAVAFVASDSWSETGITWKNKPSSNPIFASWLPQEGRPVEFSVTPQVLEALAGDRKLSLHIFSTTNIGGPGFVGYGSREASAALRPQLILWLAD